MSLLLTLVMCLSLVACGGTLDKLKVIVIDDSVEHELHVQQQTAAGYEINLQDKHIQCFDL